MDSYSMSYYTSIKLYFNLKSRMAIRESEYRKKLFLDSTNIIECILCQASLSHRRFNKGKFDRNSFLLQFSFFEEEKQ